MRIFRRQGRPRGRWWSVISRRRANSSSTPRPLTRAGERGYRCPRGFKTWMETAASCGALAKSMREPKAAQSVSLVLRACRDGITRDGSSLPRRSLEYRRLFRPESASSAGCAARGARDNASPISCGRRRRPSASPDPTATRAARRTATLGVTGPKSADGIVAQHPLSWAGHGEGPNLRQNERAGRTSTAVPDPTG